MARPMRKNARAAQSAPGAARCIRKFLRFFPGGFSDETYIDWERGYKLTAHERWQDQLSKPLFAELLADKRYEEISAIAARIEGRTNLLFSFEKMSLRDAIRSQAGARIFSQGLFEFLYGPGSVEERFTEWASRVGSLPRRQTRVLTWPVLTVFPFIAEPREHIFLKPTVTRIAAQKYGFDFQYDSKPNAATYRNLLRFAAEIRRDIRELRPADMIDIQSFIWVQGSEEYPG